MRQFCSWLNIIITSFVRNRAKRRFFRHTKYGPLRARVEHRNSNLLCTPRRSKKKGGTFEKKYIFFSLTPRIRLHIHSIIWFSTNSSKQFISVSTVTTEWFTTWTVLLFPFSISKRPATLSLSYRWTTSTISIQGSRILHCKGRGKITHADDVAVIILQTCNCT